MMSLLAFSGNCRKNSYLCILHDKWEMCLAHPVSIATHKNSSEAVERKFKTDWNLSSGWAMESIGPRYKSVLAGVFGLSVPVLIPVGQFGLVFGWLWDQYNRPVDRKLCSCSCWDTVFKGSYETGVGKYKHFYFNSNQNMAIIWSLTVVCTVALYEGCKHCLTQFLNGKLHIKALSQGVQ